MSKTPVPITALNIKPPVSRSNLLQAIEHEIIPRPQIVEPGEEPVSNVPDYVKHAPDIGRVGRLTSEALAVEYESAAKAIEAMGAHLLDLQKQMDAEAALILTAIEEVNAVAKHYREQGTIMFGRIQDCARQTARVREICSDLTPKVAS